jgi:hypothetical protein
MHTQLGNECILIKLGENGGKIKKCKFFPSLIRLKVTKTFPFTVIHRDN